MVITIMILVGIGIWLIFGGNKPSTTTSSTSSTTNIDIPRQGETATTSRSDSVSTSSPVSTTTRSFVITAQNYSFSPSTITVKKGDTVSITLKNAGGTHDLTIDEFNKATPRTNAGQQATITFIADKEGSFEYYCSIGPHRALGMKGILTVIE